MSASPSVFHVFGSGSQPLPPPGPTALVDAFAGIVFGTEFTTLDDKDEQNCYEFCWVVQDAVNGYKLIAQFQQNSDGTHQEHLKLTQRGSILLDVMHPVTVDLLGNPSPVKLWGVGDTLQFFLNKDRTLQLFWYRNGPIVFGQNDDIPKDFTISDEALVPMPMEGSTHVDFTGFRATCQMGQIYQTAGHVQTSDVASPASSSNLVYTLTGSHPGIEGIDFTISSPT